MVNNISEESAASIFIVEHKVDTGRSPKYEYSYFSTRLHYTPAPFVGVINRHNKLKRQFQHLALLIMFIHTFKLL
jgi:hypothetical protein